MIPAPTRPAQPEPAPARWQALWREAVRDPHELLQMLGLEAEANTSWNWLQTVGSPDRVCVSPGNHDSYLRSSLGCYTHSGSDLCGL